TLPAGTLSVTSNSARLGPYHRLNLSISSTGTSPASASWTRVGTTSPRCTAASIPPASPAGGAPPASGVTAPGVVDDNIPLPPSELAPDEAAAQAGPQPHRRQVQERDDADQQQRRGVHHRPGRLAVGALKAGVVDVEPQVQEAALRVHVGEDVVG